MTTTLTPTPETRSTAAGEPAEIPVLREIDELALELGGIVLLVAGTGDRIGIPTNLAADAGMLGPEVHWPQLGRLVLIDEHTARFAARQQAPARAVYEIEPPTFLVWLV